MAQLSKSENHLGLNALGEPCEEVRMLLTASDSVNTFIVFLVLQSSVFPVLLGSFSAAFARSTGGQLTAVLTAASGSRTACAHVGREY